MSPSTSSSSGGTSSGAARSKFRTAAPRARRSARSVVPKYPEPPVTRTIMASSRVPGSELPALEAPADASPHPLLERDRRIVAELGFGLGHRAGDGLVHLGEHVELLLVAARRLDRGV